MRKFSLSAILLVSICGCSSLGVRHGIDVNGNAVRSYMAESCQAPPDFPYTPYDFYVAGIGEARRQCAVFLEHLTNLNRDSRFLSSSIATANSQTAVILGVTSPHSTKAIAVVAAATEFVRKIITGFAEEYAFASFAHEIAPKVAELMNAFLQDDATTALVAQIKNPDPTDRVAAYCIAADLVRSFANYCSPTTIDSQVRSAILSSTPQKNEVVRIVEPAVPVAGRSSAALARRSTVTIRRQLAAPALTIPSTLAHPTFTLGAPPP